MIHIKGTNRVITYICQTCFVQKSSKLQLFPLHKSIAGYQNLCVDTTILAINNKVKSHTASITNSTNKNPHNNAPSPNGRWKPRIVIHDNQTTICILLATTDYN